LYETTGELNEAAEVYRRACLSARQSGDHQGLSGAFNCLGRVQIAQGDLLDALKSFRDSLAIAEPLAKFEVGDIEWQRLFLTSLCGIGDIQMAQRDIGGALKSYKVCVATMERLAKDDPGNSQLQHERSVYHNRIGDVKLQSQRLENAMYKYKVRTDRNDALKSYEASYAIMLRLANSAPSNDLWRREVSATLNKIATVRLEESNYLRAMSLLEAPDSLRSALKSSRESLAITVRLAKSQPT